MLFKKNYIKLFTKKISTPSKTIFLKSKLSEVGQSKYLPSFSKEWNNTAYFYNKNNLLNIPFINPILNKIIRNYFDLYLNNVSFIDRKTKAFSMKMKRRFMKKIRRSLKKIYISNVETKYTNNKMMVTIYVLDKEKDILNKKFIISKKKINEKILLNFFAFYKLNIKKIYTALNIVRNKYLYTLTIINKKNYFSYIFKSFGMFIKLKDLYLRKVWAIIIKKYGYIHLNQLKEYTSLYSLNRYKFDQSSLLPKLNNILQKITNKKIEYNIVNIKSITYNSSLITNILALKLKKRRSKHMKNMMSVLNKAHFPNINFIQERSLGRRQESLNYVLNKYKDLKIISNINNDSLDTLLYNVHSSTFKLNSINNLDKIHKLIYNSIKYKNLGGIRLEVKGRLTKRYRADRSVYSFRLKGGLKNIDSSFRRLPSVLFRGNKNPNASYSFSKGKRRIGAFAVKGWIGGK